MWKSLQTYWKPLKYVSELSPSNFLNLEHITLPSDKQQWTYPFSLSLFGIPKECVLKKKVKMFFPFLSQCLDIISEGFFCSWWQDRIFDIANVTNIWGLLIRGFLVMTSRMAQFSHQWFAKKKYVLLCKRKYVILAFLRRQRSGKLCQLCGQSQKF